MNVTGTEIRKEGRIRSWVNDGMNGGETKHL